ncbi:MAG: glycoside hydrolase family 15 protein [Bdellovibrionota bacterium]
MLGNILLLLASIALAPVSTCAAPRKMAPAPWLEREVPFAIGKIFLHSAQPGMPIGSVIASPSRSAPDYYFHWIRDAALTMDTFVTLYSQESDKAKKPAYLNRLLAYADFSLGNQRSHTLTGLGEPKFNVDGSPFNGPWGRPQNDGPALRAIVFIRLANQLISEGQVDLVRKAFYDGTPSSLIKTDLEYVSHHWRDASFDLWEEELGDHFYTRMVQRKALLLGAQVAKFFADEGAASWYLQQAKAMEKEMDKFWDPKVGYIRATLMHRGGLSTKKSGLDVAVLLGALHGGMNDGFYDLRDERVQKTISYLVQTFGGLYSINNRKGVPGVAIGRYPEDVYGGTDFEGGNPWVLATLAVAEATYRTAKTQADIDLADSFVARVIYHANGDGTLSEQMQRDSGFMCSAENLTWNYSAILTTAQARDSAVAKTNRK